MTLNALAPVSSSPVSLPGDELSRLLAADPPPTMLAQRRATTETVEATTVTVPHPAFTNGRGGFYDPTVVTGAGRRWITADDLGRYLRTQGNTHLSAADLVAANPGKVQTLNGRAVFEVGTTVQAVPGAARIASAAGVDIFADIKVQAGVAAVIGGNVGGPVNLFALTPINAATGQPDFANTKIFGSTEFCVGYRA